MSAFDGHFGRVGPRGTGRGLHYIEHDIAWLKVWGFRPEDVPDLAHTGWLWEAIRHALFWDVPKH